MAGEAVEKLAKGPEFVDKYKKRFNADVQVYSPYSYDAVYVIADAIKRAGKADRARRSRPRCRRRTTRA